MTGLNARAVVGGGSSLLLSAMRLGTVLLRREGPRSSHVTMTSPEAAHDLLTDAQLAVRWQLSRGTLANQRSQGRGPAYLKLAGRIRYRLSDIEAYEQAAIRVAGASRDYLPR